MPVRIIRITPAAGSACDRLTMTQLTREIASWLLAILRATRQASPVERGTSEGEECAANRPDGFPGKRRPGC